MSNSTSIGIEVPPLDERVLELLRELVETHSSSRAVAESMGQAHNYVARILRGETKLRLDVLERILHAMGLSTTYFFRLVTAGDEALDVATLLRFFPADGSEESPFFDAVSPRLDEILARGSDPSIVREIPSRRDEIEKFEALRFSDRDAAEKGLEALIPELLDAAPGDAPACPGLLGDLAIALATWATVQRFRSERRAAARALRRAMLAAESSGELRPVAIVLQRSAYLMRDLARGRTALLLLDRANDLYLRDGDLEGCAKVFVDRAIVLVHLGLYENAVECYETALRLLPENDKLQRFGALSGLAHCHENLGQLELALKRNEAAAAVYDGIEDMQLAYLVWNRANLCAALGGRDPEPAYRRAMELLERHAEPLAVGLCAVDLAAVYVRRGESRKLAALGDEILAWLPALRGNRTADAILMELVRCAKWGEVTQQLLVESRRRLRRSAD